MKKVKILSNEQGQCPYCNGMDIDYESADFDGNMVCFPAHCNDCERDFEEWYELTFTGHNVGDGCCEEAAGLIGKEIEMDEPDDNEDDEEDEFEVPWGGKEKREVPWGSKDVEDPRDNNTCPYCGKDADFVDSDEDSTKYQCNHCGKDFLIHDDGTYTTRNGAPIKEE